MTESSQFNKLLLGKLGMGDTDDITIYRDTKYSRYWYRIV